MAGRVAGERDMADLIGTSGNDSITGTSSADTIDGGSGNDVLRGGAGNDSITGGPGTDSLYGDEGNDTLTSKRGTGPDYFDGGAGSDRVSADFAKAAVALRIDISNPAILQYVGEGSTIVNVEALTVMGGTSADTFIGGGAADSLSGYDGDDILLGAGGNDALSGGNGYDTASFRGTASDYSITLQSDGSYKIVSAAEGTDTLTGIENLRFADGDRPIGGYTASAAYWGSANGVGKLVTAADIPDGSGATPGTGFTITGLTRASDGTWWGANEGQAEPGDSSYTPSLVHLSADFKTKIGEIILTKPIRSLQGLAYNSSTGEIFVASLSEGLVRVYKGNGQYVRSIAPTAGTSVNGLAYDSTRDALIIGHENGNSLVRTIEWRSATTGAFIKSITVANEPDHLFFDPDSGVQGALYYSYGDAGAGRIGYIDKVDVASGAVLGTYELPAADAIEGIYFIGSKLYVANDAYFHRGNPALSRVLTFDVTPEARLLDKRAATTALNVDLSLHDQTLADGTRLVGVDRLFFHGGSGGDIVKGGAFADILVGGEGNDSLAGAGGNDRLVGAAGNDSLTGGGGDDGIEGGSGSDIATFSGSRSQYIVTQLSSTSLSIRDSRSGSPDGTDLVADVESFKFADGTYTLSQLLGSPPPPPSGGTIQLSGASIAENVGTGRLIGSLSVSSGGTYTYSLLNDDGDRFQISSANLLAGLTMLDFEAGASRTISVRATSSTGSVITQNLVITVLDVNEAPTALLSNVVNAVAENSSIGTGLKVADVSVSDDALGAEAFSLSGADASSFELRGTTNKSLYYIGPTPDYETKSAYSVTVNVDDPAVGASPDASLAFVLTIVDQNESGGAGGTPGNDSGPNALYGTTGDDSIQGFAGDDDLFGLAGNDMLDGGDGNDKLVGGAGGDRLLGGAGSDTASYETAVASLVADLGAPSKNTGDASGDVYDSIENFVGSNFGDTLNGSNSANMIAGGDGADRINGLGGADTLLGGSGDDVIAGQGGNDRIDGGAGDDMLSGGLGGRDWFAYFQAGWGRDTISDFEDGIDLIDMRGSGFAFTQLVVAASGADVSISLGSDMILLKNLQVSQVSAADFLF